MSEAGARAAASQAHQQHWARLIALTRRFGDLDLAKAAAEAFATAVARW